MNGDKFIVALRLVTIVSCDIHLVGDHTTSFLSWWVMVAVKIVESTMLSGVVGQTETRIGKPSSRRQHNIVKLL